MSIEKNSINKPVLGLNKDVHPSEQPKETIRFALNSIKEDTSGNFNNYQSEPSNELCYELPLGYKTIGSIYLEDGEKVIFATNNTESKIILLDSYCNATELVSNTCLGFSTKNTILGEYRVREGCNRIIYFNDGLNPDRFLDLDDLDSFKDDSGNWDCNLMRLTPEFKIPQVKVNSVNNSGGNLKVGSYAFAIELLDNNLNSIDYGVFTNYVPVYNDNTSDTYSSIRGNLPAPQFNSDAGGIEITNKSFSLQFTNLDTSFSFARLIVFYRGSDNSTLETAYKLEDFIPISDSVIEYEFTNLNNATLDDATKYKVPKQKYFSTEIMEQVQNRLVRANVKEDIRDYSKYQKVANNITVTWRHTTEFPEDINAPLNTKNPLNYINGNTFLADEVYALGIEYIFNDGTISPVFHIPGRPADIFDTVDLEVGVNINPEDAAHLELSIGDKIPRWKYENTATGAISGNLGYYETNTNYPETLDCDNEPIYGELAGTPVRHHRIPCRRNRPITFKNSSGRTRVSKIGLEFDNIEYPDPNIVGHRFVSAKRTESDKTVLDYGFIVGYGIEGEEFFTFGGDSSISGSSFNGATSVDPELKFRGLISPKILSGELTNLDYIKVVSYQNVDDIVNSNIQDFDDFTTNGAQWNYNSNLSTLTTRYRVVNKNKLISPNSIFNGDFARTIKNQNFSNNILAVELNRGVFQEPGLNNNIANVIVSLKRNVTPFTNLFQLQYEPISDILTLSDSQITYQGKAFTNELDIYSIKRISSALGGNWLPELFGSNNVSVRYEYAKNIFVDSTVNFDLRVEGTGCNTVYNTNQELSVYTINKVAEFNGSNWRPRTNPCREYYRYNKDYSPFNTNVGIQLPFNFDYCDACLAHRPNRIIFSPQSFNEEISDFYRLNFVDDYIDLPYHRGKITGMKYKNNKLYVHTEQTTFILQPNPQFISTDQNTAYLNTGDFLSIPPYEIMQTDLGYGGLQNKLATSNSEYGYVWFDSLTGKVLSLTQGIDNLSNLGMLQWFKENSRLEINEFVKSLTGKPYLYNDSINDIDGVGISMVYDPRFERVIINKKDYTPKDKDITVVNNSTQVNSLEQNKLYFNTNTNQFVVNYNSSLRKVSLENSNFFHRRGWCISYSFKNKAFISFHSYLTDIMFNDETFYYTVKDNKIYKHLHKNSFSKYFDTQYPFIIEYVANDFSTDITKAVHYYATFTDNNYKVDNTNYNNLWAYNTNQSTGKLNLNLYNQQDNPYSQISNNTNTKYIVETDLNSKISNLWDYSTSNIIFSENPEELENELTLNGYIDKVPQNIDYSKSPYQAGELRDKFLIVRLYYYPNKDSEKVTHRLSNTMEMQSIR